MDALQFCYWLQGHLEISETTSLDEKEVQIIKDHLALVFNKVTPDRSTQKVEDFFKYPHCGSTTISTDPNMRSYCANGNINPDMLKFFFGS